MVVLRAIVVAVLLACGPVSAWANGPLANFDRALDSFCRRLPKASASDAVKIRGRLAALWRQRQAILIRLPPKQRAIALRASTASAKCLLLARRLAAAKTAAKADKKKPQGKILHYRHRQPVRHWGKTAVGKPMRKESASKYSAKHERARGQEEKLNTVVNRMGTIENALRPTIVSRPGSAAGSRGPASATAPPQSANGGQPAAAVLQDFFPWPPPAPSDRVVFRLRDLATSSPLPTLGTVAYYLEGILRDGGYRSWAYFRAPNGFVLVPPIEALNADGDVLPGDARWSQNPKVAASSLSFWDLLLLSHRPVGHYRVFVFIVTTEAAKGTRVSGEEMWGHVKRWVNTGLPFLPPDVATMPVSPDHHLIAHVYEFERSLAGQTSLAEHAQWPIDRHFASGGVVIKTSP